MASIEIHSLQTVSGNQPRIRDIGELLTQTFKAGTPVMSDAATGYMKAWDGLTVTAGIAGFSKLPGKNLTTSATAQQITQGNVPNEPLAVNIQRPYVDPDGCTMFETSQPGETIFQAQVGPAQSVTAANVGKSYGLTIDTDGHWYVDTTKTASNQIVCTVVKLDPNDQSATPRGVYITILQAAAQPIS